MSAEVMTFGGQWTWLSFLGLQNTEPVSSMQAGADLDILFLQRRQLVKLPYKEDYWDTDYRMSFIQEQKEHLNRGHIRHSNFLSVFQIKPALEHPLHFFLHFSGLIQFSRGGNYQDTAIHISQ